MKQSHNWVLLEDHRNGKTQVYACSNCGVMKFANSPLVAECEPKKPSLRSLSDQKQASVQVEA